MLAATASTNSYYAELSLLYTIDYNLQGDWLDEECRLCGFLSSHHPCCEVITTEWIKLFNDADYAVQLNTLDDPWFWANGKEPEYARPDFGLFGYPPERVIIRLDKAKRLS